eukprot:5913793-Ditylum_brightwellii.AAC.1
MGEMIHCCANSQKDTLIPSLKTTLSRYFSIQISCSDHDDVWTRTPLLPEDAAFIETALQRYFTDPSFELVH